MSRKQVLRKGLQVRVLSLPYQDNSMEIGKWYMYKERRHSFFYIAKTRGNMKGFSVLKSKAEFAGRPAHSKHWDKFDEITNADERSRLSRIIVKYAFEHKKIWKTQEFFTGSY